MRTHISHFDPDVISIEESCRDFSEQLQQFNAGSDKFNFNCFIKEEALSYRDQGNGATYVVWNVVRDEKDEEISRELAAYYTLATTAIPFVDRIRLDPDEAELYGNEFDTKRCGISALEIKMFAVDIKYQDVFYSYNDDDMPISAWIFQSIIEYARNLIANVAGFKAILLFAVPGSEKFYLKNGFQYIEKNMQPLYSVDSDLPTMYLSLIDVHMNYDD